jgi:4-alpha-glucanotransferase
MNDPSVQGGNWRWRLDPDAFDAMAMDMLCELTRRHNRYQDPAAQTKKIG